MDIDKISPLSRVKIVASGTEFEGILLPKEGDTQVLKMDSGYNIGILPQNIEKVDLIEGKQQKDIQKENIVLTQKKDLQTVRIIHTGGTIASKVDYKTGGVVSDFTPEALVEMFPELKEIANMQSNFIGNMSSDDFRFSHFNKLASEVLNGVKEGVTKFIVTSGTDFLHYLSAALSFILKDVPASVLVVGAQRSSDRGSSDAGMNMVCATTYLTKTNFQGVCICMHGNQEDTTCDIINGTHARKMHSSRRDAFHTINLPVIATVDYTTRKIRNIISHEEIKSTDIPEKLSLLNEDLKIGLVYSHPNMFAKELNVYETFDGIVLAGSGLGHFPISKPNEDCGEHDAIKSSLKKLAEKIPVVMSSQTINGRVDMDVYSPGRELQAIGIIGQNSIMMPEVSYIKLAWLLSNYSKEETKELFMKDIAGELNSGESLKF